MGQLLYSPIDLQTNLDDQPLLGLVDIADVVHKDFGKSPLRQLCSQNDRVTYLLSYRGSNGKAVNANSEGLFLDTKSGRKHVSVKQYIERIEIDQPAAVIAFADEVSSDEGPKRLNKAFDRTRSWRSHVVQALKKDKDPSSSSITSSPALLAVALPNKEEVEAWKAEGVQGVVAGGLYLDNKVTPAERAEQLRRLRQLVGESMPILVLQSSQQALRHAESSGSTGGEEEGGGGGSGSSQQQPPKATFKKTARSQQQQQQQAKVVEEVKQTFVDVLDDISNGADVIYSVYPLRLTLQGRAFTLRPPEQILVNTKAVVSASSSSASAAESTDHDETSESESGRKRPRADESGEEDLGNKKVRSEVSQGVEAFTMNLWDKRYERDGSPLVPHCGCASCTSHTRAYIHHLLRSRELLGEVLLYQHNQWQLLHAFTTVREQVILQDKMKHFSENKLEKKEEAGAAGRTF
eukprot:scaffold4354_cov196-Ochromonas_danica.AAC.8